MVMFMQSLKITDCHCDTIWLMGKENYNFGRRNPTGHLDLPRLQEGGVGRQFFAVCTAPLQDCGHLHLALKQIADYRRTLSLHKSICRAWSSKKIWLRGGWGQDRRSAGP